MKKKLKLVLFIFCSLVLLLIFVTLLLPSGGQVTSSVTIDAPDSVVLHQLRTLKSYPEWFPWIAENNADIVYYSDDGKALQGFSFRNRTAEHNLGRFELGRQEGDSLLYYSVYLQDLPEFYGAFAIRTNGKSTLLAWKLNIRAGWKPWLRFYAAMMYKMTKPAMDEGLERLKKVCEE